MMTHKCKVTVIDKKCFTDFQEQYLADSKSGVCPVIFKIERLGIEK